MQPDRPSTTAEMVCAWRALEYLLPEDQRILDDPYARAFLGPARGALLDAAEKLPPRALLALYRRVDRVIHGVMTFVVARHRTIDELICAQEGLEQVVLLGTGYDSRAKRLVERLPAGVTFFEVDHPATARRRAERLDAAFGEGPRARTVSVNIDFQRESLEERLRGAGFDPARRTFWSWEGVSMYLDVEPVKDTLGLIARNSPQGSLLCFDVWCPPRDGLAKLALRDLPNLAMRFVYSEPFVWGPRPEELEPLLAAQGLALIEMTPARELVARYTQRRKAWFEGKDSMHLCLAEVDRDLAQ
ncbi:MAG: SAM-dependent methyltransferase [Planctomycetota bacterium]